MSDSETLLKATLNRLTARIGRNLIDISTKIALITKDAPEKIKREWDLFQEEVITEAERLKKESGNENFESMREKSNSENEHEQEKIDQLRAKVSRLSKYFEAK